MTILNGRQISRQDLSRRVGTVDQVGGVRLCELSDGVGRGLRIAQLRTGAGLNATLLIDRGMDIYDADFRGLALAWLSSTGPLHPSFYQEEGAGWLRGFGGGLMVTCGLTTMGAPSVDEGVPLGLHGRASYTPASHVNAGGTWENDQYLMFVEGEVRETAVFGENVVLKRRVEARLGEKRISVFDTVVNEGFQRTPLMLLYHINTGFPLVDEGSRLIAPSRTVTPRDDEARSGLKEHDSFSAPVPGYKEQVFSHDMDAGPDGYVTAAMLNRALNGGQGLGLYVRYRQRELPWFNEWKMMGEGVYTVGIEPGTTHTLGRAAARADGTLQFLEPGQERHYHLELGILSSPEEIDSLEKRARDLGKA